MAHDPLARLLPCGNRGGFRFRGTSVGHKYSVALLYTSGNDPDWPDSFDPETGLFTYFGDNKRPGSALHATPRGGNELLRFAFGAAHGSDSDRGQVPPFFVFRRSEAGPDVEFLGLAVPGAKDVSPDEDLVAVWRTTAGQRFQNYRATFTVLDVGAVPRGWIAELVAGERLGLNCPEAFRLWSITGRFLPLEAPRTVDFRTPEEQAPSPADLPLVQAVIDHYRDNRYGFERCAMELWKMLARESVTSITATRRSADGGRDAFGLYSIGPEGDRIHLDFSLEAKCYALGNSAGVRDVARLISRLKHRDFGIFVTTSHVGPHAYRELREDGHPVVVICGRDIGQLLRERGTTTPASVRAWLSTLGT